jgi:GTPase SAR1 family protein
LIFYLIAPTRSVDPTIGSKKSIVPYPTTGKGENKSQERITIIDVSGDKKFRERSWSEFYDQIHGLIFVIDASEKRRITENKDILDDLLENDELRDKPILM